MEENTTSKYIEKLEKRIETNKSAIEYALTRIDILIISLSTGALGFDLSILDTFNESNNNIFQEVFFKFSIFLFSSAITLNLTSQYSSYKAHKYDNEFTSEVIREKLKKKAKKEKSKIELVQKIYNTYTITANSLSLISLITGILISTLIIILK